MKITTENPATGQSIRQYACPSHAEVEDIIRAADTAVWAWARVPVAARAAAVRGIAAGLRRRAEELANLITTEMGKPLAQSRAEIEKCALVCEYYGEHGPAFLADELIPAGARRSLVAHEPIGLVLAVMPWNFPFWQVFRFAAPALTAGNGALLKHASNVCGCALAIEELIRAAGLPEHLFRALLIPSGGVEAVIRHPAVRAVTLTGSEPAGRAVAGCAGQSLKKTVLELGGSDPYIVLEDADLDLAAEKCAASRLINSGQSCIAAKRFIVVSAVEQDFLSRFRQRLAAARMGNPLEEATQIGPLARADLRRDLHEQVIRSVRKGARLLLGGELPPRGAPGYFYPATLLAGVVPGMPVHDEETFGPVAAVVTAQDEADAIRIANATRFGLGAAVFTRDSARGEAVARRLQAGTVCVNDFVKSDPRLPFGGIKDSGYGRELSRQGLLEFVNIKSVVVA